MAERLYHAVVSVDMMIVVHDGQNPEEVAVGHLDEAVSDTPRDYYNVESMMEITKKSEIPKEFKGTLPYNSDENRPVESYLE